MLRFTENIIAQMTPACNLRCKYCYEYHDASQNGKQITFDKFKQYLDTILYYRCVLGSIENKVDWHFHGGEVFLLPWPEILKMIEYVEERRRFFPGLSWSIQTNATLITDEIAKCFADHKKSIGFSFDGFKTEKRMPEKANREFIERLRGFHNKYGTTFTYLTVLSKDNLKTWLDDWYEVSDFCSNVGINPLCAVTDDEIPTPEEYWEYWAEPVLKSLLTDKRIEERNIVQQIMPKAIQGICYSVETRTHTGCFDRICAHGSNMTTLTYDGKLAPCDKFLDNGDFIDTRKVIDINDRDFLGAQNAKYVVNYHAEMFKKENKLNCDACPARWICTGECQSYNLSRYGEMRLGDFLCPFYKRIYDFIQENWIEILLKNKIELYNSPTQMTTYALKEVSSRGLKFKMDSSFIWLEKIED